jgi:hypothetical protein
MILPLSVTSTFFFILNVRKIRPTSVPQYVSHNHMTDYRLLLSLLLQSHIREVSCTLSEVPVPLLCESHHLHHLRLKWHQRQFCDFEKMLSKRNSDNCYTTYQTCHSISNRHRYSYYRNAPQATYQNPRQSTKQSTTYKPKYIS